MAKIYSPNKHYTGISASVVFAMGVGETDKPNLIEWFKEHGYRVEEEIPNVPEDPEEEPEEPDNLDEEEPDNKEDEDPLASDGEEKPSARKGKGK